MPKKSIAKEMEELKQRRDDRKRKAEDEKQHKIEGVDLSNVKSNDAQFEKMVKKKKATIPNNPEPV